MEQASRPFYFHDASCVLTHTRMGPATLAASGRGPSTTATGAHPPGEDGGGEQRVDGGGGTSADADANLAVPPPAVIKPKKRKRKDASGPTGPPADSADDYRDLIYGAQVREEEAVGGRHNSR
jgi:hypothetical protein